MDQHGISDLEIIGLEEKLKPIIWVLKISGSIRGQLVTTYGTCFSIRYDGLALTSSHSFDKMTITKIHARRLDEDDFPHEARIVFMRKKWDLALLEVSGIANCSIGKLASNGSLAAGQTLLHIGHPHDFVGSVLFGRVSYRCVEDVILPTDSETCRSYISTALAKTPNYRFMGHIWNDAVFKRFPSTSFPFEKNLHPLIPVIQIAGLVCGEGCSGGPIFNSKGEIVGMLALQSDGYAIAIHVTLLREFLKIALSVKEGNPQADAKGQENKPLSHPRKGSFKRART